MAKRKMPRLTVGKGGYRKEDFFITDKRYAACMVRGQCYLFFTLKNNQKLANRLMPDGLVYQCRNSNAEALGPGAGADTFVQVFLRAGAADTFTYLGECRKVTGETGVSNKFLFPVPPALCAAFPPPGGARQAGGPQGRKCTGDSHLFSG
jgi:hypothetical protein